MDAVDGVALVRQEDDHRGHEAVDQAVVEIGLHVLRLEKARGQDGVEGGLDLCEVGGELALLLELGEIGHGADRLQPGHEQIFRIGEKGVDVEEIGSAERVVDGAEAAHVAERAGAPGAHGVEADAIQIEPAAVDPVLVGEPVGVGDPRAFVAGRGEAGEAVGGIVDLLADVVGERRGGDERRVVDLGAGGRRGGEKQAGEDRKKKAGGSDFQSRCSGSGVAQDGIFPRRAACVPVNGQSDQHGDGADGRLERMPDAGLDEADERDEGRKGPA